jgi:hypothetical protein
MFRQVLINILFYAGLPVSLLLFAAGMWKKRLYLGFLTGFAPLALLWLLLIPDILSAYCPEPCAADDEGFALIVGTSLLHLVFYTGASSFLYLLNYFLIDPATAIIRPTWQKVVILFQLGMVGLVAAGIVAFNLEFVNLVVVWLGMQALGILSRTGVVVGALILVVVIAGIWAGYRFYRNTTP